MLSNFHYVIFLKTESVDTYYKADKEKAKEKALRQHSILEQQQIDIEVTHWIAVQSTFEPSYWINEKGFK